MPAVRHPSLVKAAAGDRKAFETALASLGRSTITSLAPSISKYEIGFQVLDQDDDNYVAVGVFGYKLGSRLMYVPMFYRDGIIKGVEQLRDPKRAMTVPLSDNYVNKFLSDSGDQPAKLVGKDKTRTTAQPSLWQLKYPPTKFGGDRQAAFDLFRDDLARPMTRASTWDVFPDLLKEAGEEPAAMAELGRLVVSYPWFAAAVERFHGWDKLAAALARSEAVAARRVDLRRRVLSGARTSTKRASAPVRPDLSVVRVSASRGPGGLDDVLGPDLAAQGEFAAGRNYYLDRRKEAEVTTVEALWGKGPGGGALENPGHSGVYRVLGEDMKFHECAVFFPLVGFEDTPGACVVVRLEGGAYYCGARTAVWVASGPPDLAAARTWYDGLPKAENIKTDGRVLAVHLAQGGHLVGSVPFHVGDDGSVWGAYGSAANEPYWTRPGYRFADDPGRDHGCLDRRVRVLDTAGRMTVQSNVLYLPGGARYVKLDGSRFRPAFGDDTERYLVPTVKAAAADRSVLRVTRHPAGLALESDAGPAGPTKAAADVEADLVEFCGLRPALARQAVETAGRTGAAGLVVKYAAPYGPPYLPNDFPNAPPMDDPQLINPGSFADDVVPSEQGASLALTVNDLMPDAGSSDRYQPYPADYGLRVPLGGVGSGQGGSGAGGSGDGIGSGESGDGAGDDAGTMKSLSNAAGGGIKELFDTASLSAIVKRKGVPRIADKLARTSVQTMNAVADALCHLYWNPDAWAKQFGQSEVGPMEDQLTDQFKGIGELYLTLQEKNVDGARDFGILPGLDVVDAASAGGK